ncbi:MAG TPA: indole-3-glycerol phosphate synthase TrpC [Acidimicrobiales bacterium]|nr:indole-3-glycerol phosphate synthase TrpC [Acidimicrobiales bacterium]
MPAATYLDEILAVHRAAAAADGRDVAALVAEAAACGRGRPFADALRRHEGLAVIAEIKRRSPARGDLDPGLDPAAVARDYEAGGAACVSVLSDVSFFGGSAADVTAAHDACGLPVLRKDFTVAEADVADARLMGADAVLLIVAALSDGELGDLLGLAGTVGLDALVEAHDEGEVERALAAGAELVGVNQRDLVSFAVDHERALRVAAAIPADVVAVAESGIRGGDDARRLADAGYRAVLVGETLMRAGDRRAVLRDLGGHPVGDRLGRADRVGRPGRVGS